MTRFSLSIAAFVSALPGLAVAPATRALADTPAVASAPATAGGQGPMQAAMLVADEAAVLAAAAALRPGEFHWTAQEASDAPVLIAVSLADQRLYAYRGGTLFAVSTVSSGRRGHATPTGAFAIMEKQRRHFSNRYANAPMPFMQRLTSDGIALHAGALPGYPASHGCIRLPLAFAQRLFAVTQRGGSVVVSERTLAGEVGGGATARVPIAEPALVPSRIAAAVQAGGAELARVNRAPGA